jgi:malate dehydrogenase (oxaloacetate-decarboxylating)
MALAAAGELARFAQERGIHEGSIVPRLDEWEVFPRVAVAVALKAQERGLARLAKDAHHLHEEATRIIGTARAATRVLMREGLIPPRPATS